MGLTNVIVKVGNPALGIASHSILEFKLANGDVHQPPAGDRPRSSMKDGAAIRSSSSVSQGDDPLLGATTLEGFGLVLEPFRRELRPMALPLNRSA